MSTRILSCIALVAACAMAPSANANSIRCGNHLIHDGQRSGTTKYEVLKKCGEPKSRMGHVWVYKKGPRTQSLHFNGSGKLIAIKDR